METQDLKFFKYISKEYLIIKIKCGNKKKFKDVIIKLDSSNKDLLNCELDKLDIIRDIADNKINLFLEFKNNDFFYEEQIHLLNVKYYLTYGPFNKRINEKPFYSYLEKMKFNINDIKALIKMEKIDEIYDIDSIKIKLNKKNYFENMNKTINNMYKEYNIEDFEFIVLELHYNEIKAKKNLNNSYNKINEGIIKLNKKINKVSENIQEYDLIYLYASPLFVDSRGNPSDYNEKISYREEINTILKIMNNKKNKNKKFKCLFQCASLDVLKEVLFTKKTKVLQISSHGRLNDETKDFKLVLENLEKNGQEQIIEKNVLEDVIKNNAEKIKNIDLIILANCHSGGFQELFEPNCSPKYTIYVDKKNDIDDYVCTLFCEHFYSELAEGESIYMSFKNAINKLKSDSRLDKLAGVEGIQKLKIGEIEKLIIFPDSENYLSPYAYNAKGELSINKNVMIQFDSKKYKSMIGRHEIIYKVLNDINNNNNINNNYEHQNNMIIIYGSKDTEKLDFVESLIVYLFERKIIYDYEIYKESEIQGIETINLKINELEQIVKNERKKYIIVIQIEENEKILYDIKKFKNNEYFYFIILIDKEDLNDLSKDLIEDLKKNNNSFNALIEKLYAKQFINALFNIYGYYLKGVKLRDSLLQKAEPKNELYEPGKLSKIVDEFISNISQISLKKSDNTLEISLTPQCAYLFLLSKMPKGLPSYFIKLIFKDNYEHELVSQYSNNKWKYINNEIKFNQSKINKENENQINLEFDTFEKYAIKYILKALKLYAKILYFNIRKDRDKIMYPDENFHFLFNSYNDEGIWKSNIPNIKDDDNINENDFIDNDFKVENHRENIINLIGYLVEKIDYINDGNYITYIDYLVEILLLFPSYFFLKKICKNYIKKCKELCLQCINYYKNKNNNNIIINNNKDKQFLDKFIFQFVKLSLFLYSISNEYEINEDFLNDKLKSELDFLKFIKKGDKNIDNILNKTKSDKKKSIIYYVLGRNYFTKNDDKSEYYLNEALKFISSCREFKFLKIRIKIDLCYILLNKINKGNKVEENKIEEKINILDTLLKELFNDKLYHEELNLRQKFSKKLKPNIIMLNSNPLNSGYSLYSSGIYTDPNNQYYILERLRKFKNNEVKRHIRIKTYILNKQNLEEALKEEPEILIIQSDDFTENGDIMMETDEGMSEKLSIDEFKNMLNKFTKKLKFRIVLLSFMNCSKLIKVIEDKLEYEYLIYFKDIKIDSFYQIEIDNRVSIRSITDFIYLVCSYENIYDKEKLIKDKLNERKIFEIKYGLNNSTIIINDNQINNNLTKGIFFSEPFLELPNIKYHFKQNELYYYKDIMNDKIKAILKRKKEEQIFYISKSEENKYKKMGFDIIKYFYRHEKFNQFYYIDTGKRREIELIAKKEIENKEGKNEENTKFYFIYNSLDDNDAKEIINALLSDNSSYLIINELEDKENYSNEIFEDNKIIEKSLCNDGNENFSIYENEVSYSESDSEEESD